MPARLTTISVAAAKARKTRREIPDHQNGLYLSITPNGVKSWTIRYRHDGRNRKLTVGRADKITLATARITAAEVMKQVGEGGDPAAEKQRAKQISAGRAAKLAEDSVEAMAEAYLRQVRPTLRPATMDQYDRVLLQIVAPAWDGRTVHDIRRRDVIGLIERVAAERGPVISNRALAVITTWFAWMLSRDIVATSPCIGVKRVAKETPRERTLDDGEIAALWRALDDEGTTGAVIRFMLLTGCRRDEARLFDRRELDFDAATWTLPKARSKNGREHTTPLTPQVVTLLQSLPRTHGSSSLVFTINGKTPPHLDRLKVRLDAKLGFNKKWVWHDLRRSVASGLQRLGVRLEVTEKVLGHVSGSFAGVVGIYQRHDFRDEKRDALTRWADHIEQLISGGDGKVIKLRG